MGLKPFYIGLTIVFSRCFAQFKGGLALFGEILAVLSLIIVSLVSFLTLKRSSRIEKMIPSLDDIVRVNEDKTIDMDPRLQAIVQGVGQTMMQSFKMSALQGLSVDSKLQKGLKGAMAQDIVEEKLPLLQAAGDFLGFNTKAYIKKNPDALFQLVQIPAVRNFIGGFLGNNGALGSNSGNRGKM